MSAPGRRPWLYDPAAGGLLVRAHRPPSVGAAGSVVSDVLAAHLCSPADEVVDPDLLTVVAADVDAVGAAAVALLAERADWTVRR